MRIVFIGGGNMATALIAGLVRGNQAAGTIHVIDPQPQQRERLAQQYGVTTAETIDGQVAGSEVIVLAVKPQQLRDVAAQLAPHLKNQLVLTIAAGIRMADLSRWLGGHAAIVRCMPNTPALIGMGVTGMVAQAGANGAQREAAETILRAVGEVVWIAREEQIDAVTAVSGSGPAYVFYFIEAMQEAAVALGLTPEQGKALALATFTGAAQLAAQSDEPVEVLRERVTSKGGTTHAAIVSMQADGVKEAIGRAMQAAANRGRELGDELGRG